uniref:Amine oxidase domain-containing protein n=1 Tax=viral metagenome TaxID=1070528 RepID=A0A6C0CK05_9ZZZZ
MYEYSMWECIMLVVLGLTGLGYILNFGIGALLRGSDKQFKPKTEERPKATRLRGLSHKHINQQRNDVIVIGGGVSGLAVAAKLAKKGKKVVVLDKHPEKVGGGLHTFTLNGSSMTSFPTGLHYIGNIQKFKRTLSELTDGRSDSIKYTEMGLCKGDGIYDIIRIGDMSYYLRKGEHMFKFSLTSQFMKERQVIHDYVEAVKKSAWWSKWYYALKLLPKWMYDSRPVRLIRSIIDRKRHNNVTTETFLKRLRCSDRLLQVLSGQWGDYGVKPEESSFAMHAMVVNHYLNGGYVPEDSEAISRALVATIHDYGGEVYYGAHVKRILVKDSGRVRGVCLYGMSKYIYAPEVVSTIGYNNTGDMLSRSCHSYQKLKTSTSMCNLFVETKVDRTGHPNIWYYPKGSDRQGPYFISFHGTGVSILKPDSTSGEWRDSVEYQVYKQTMSDELLNVYRNQVGHKIVNMDAATPKTYCKYINGDGSVYGIYRGITGRADIHPDEFGIRGLRIIGQDIITMGISGALASIIYI